MFKRYFIYITSLLLLLSIINQKTAYADMVCVESNQAVDIIALLDASEKDLEQLKNCEKLVKELYSELEGSNENLIRLTTELIEAKQDVIEYKASSKRWRSISIYAGGGAIVVLGVVILVAL